MFLRSDVILSFIFCLRRDVILMQDYVLSSVTSSLLKTPARPRRSQPRPLLLSALEAAEIFPDLVAERPFIMGGYRRPGSMQQCAIRPDLPQNQFTSYLFTKKPHSQEKAVNYVVFSSNYTGIVFTRTGTN
jgi:hypothetical protein